MAIRNIFVVGAGLMGSGIAQNAVTSGVTKRSMVSGTNLCRRFSRKHISHMAMMTGITWPW